MSDDNLDVGASEDEQPDEPRYHKDDYTLKGWEGKVAEEEARWRHLGIHLNMMKYTGEELFMTQCKLQALTNCALEGDFSEENMNINLKMIIVDSMQDIRERVEPQVRQARITQGVPQPIPPEIIMPWLKKGGNGGS